ncbi:MAG: MXAN_6577-like cysteine-rich protein [Polyangiaceae bacterium]
MTIAERRAAWALWLVWLCSILAGCASSSTDGDAQGTGGSSSCSSGQALCSGTCIDVSANPVSCGACGRACNSDEICNQGSCRSKAQGCSVGLTACGGGCVNLQTAPTDCGGCGVACGAGRSCTAGVCQCLSGQTACGASCVDAQTDALNCGACSNACGSGKSCVAGQCTCPGGKLACGTSCVDSQSDPLNCGACETSCSLGQLCSSGKCVSGAAGPDACSGLALGVSISQIAVYQSVSVPIMKDGTALATSARNTDIVVGRDSLFRVFVSPATGFTPRQLSARVLVQNGASIDSYFAKADIARASQESDLTSTFQVMVPKDKITSDTRYAVELVECTTGATGAALAPRFPASDAATLGARQTGILKLKLIPLQVNSMSPDTSEASLAAYRALMLAMYPITDIEFSVGESLSVTDVSDWPAMLDQVRAKRQLDRPAADVYYYGLLKPAATFRDYCGNGCTAGVGYVPQGSTTQQATQRAALGVAFADAYSAETMAHEVGHNHGRDHAPCPQTGISGVDINYPYSGATLGVYGWDARSQALIAPSGTDIMGYCNKKWISDYTYDGLLNRVALVNGAPLSELTAGTPERFSVVLLDQRGARWGRPIDEPTLPAGAPEAAQALDDAGQPVAELTVYRTPISDVDAFSIQVPVPAANWARLRLQGGVELPFAR